jgi:mannose-1-phosphate guanylyltransferase/phosphomannomutase
MKAIIMAGGDGTRLRPVSSNKPKPMVELFDKPVLEHQIELLKRNGISEACLTLKYLPHMITEYFLGGEDFGLRLDYRIETEALGTAGGVLNCSDFIGEDDFIVISGDCVCDFDLKAIMDFHRKKKAEITLALYSHPEPLEYGLVVTNENGRIDRFIEKPAWDFVLTDQINTGIYVISSAVLKEIPRGVSYDFGRDMFPKLLGEGRGLYGIKCSGYWCDIGSPGAYLKCCGDLLKGCVRIDTGAPEIKSGVRSFTQMPEGAVISPPVYIGKNAVIDRGAKIGPNAVIGASSVIGAGAVISNSVINGAVINENADLEGAIVCRGASIGRGVTLCEGAVVGEGCVIGDNSLISAGVKLWPDRQVPAGTYVKSNITHGMLKSGPAFTRPGVITGETGVTVTAELCLQLGAAASKMGRVGIGWNGGEAAKVMAEAMGCGVNAAGGELLRFDGGFMSLASYAGATFELPVTVFVEERKEKLVITFFGKNGGKISREAERKLEAAAGQSPAATAGQIGHTTSVTGLTEAYIASAVRYARAVSNGSGTLTAAVTGFGAENRALKAALTALGCSIHERCAGIPTFQTTEGGMALQAEDEDGRKLSKEQVAVLTALIEFMNGRKELAVPYDAPDILDYLASEHHAKLLRVGRDAEADELYNRQLFMRDGIYAAAGICAWLISKNEKLSELRLRIPRFTTVTREIPLQGERGAVMRAMAAYGSEMAAEMAAGLRLDTGRGFVHISPLRERSALKIRSESETEETAEELCVEFERRAREIDGEE